MYQFHNIDSWFPLFLSKLKCNKFIRSLHTLQQNAKRTIEPNSYLITTFILQTPKHVSLYINSFIHSFSSYKQNLIKPRTTFSPSPSPSPPKPSNPQEAYFWGWHVTWQSLIGRSRDTPLPGVQNPIHMTQPSHTTPYNTYTLTLTSPNKCSSSISKFRFSNNNNIIITTNKLPLPIQIN